MYDTENDTIAAISTAVSESGIGIIRVSGPDAIACADRIYRSKNGKFHLRDAKTHTIHYGYIYDGSECIDEVLVSVMKAPGTYTAEDTVEINCHGGVFVMKKVLETILKTGVRAAEPGEFTKRAFLNGRIDLSQSEAVMDVIESKNSMALSNSLNALGGSVQRKIKSLRAQILESTAFIESALDDPEHYSADGYALVLSEKVSSWADDIRHMIRTFDDGRMLREGINTVIVGKPNAGKSSFLNLLIGDDKAIVTDIAGTTRDILTETVNIGDVTLNLADTAGIRDTSDKVEKIGVDRAMKAAQEADLIIYIVDSSTNIDMNDKKIQKAIEGKKSIILLNKTDLKKEIDTEKFRNEHPGVPVIPFSALKGSGLKEFEETLKNMFYTGAVTYNDQVVITNVRQKNLLQKALESLEMVQNSISQGMPEDFYTIDLEDAYASLGKIIGEQIEDDLADEIFSKFCMGK